MYKTAAKFYEVKTMDHSGVRLGHSVRVTTITTDNATYRYCAAADRGCSRDYFVPSDAEAVKLFLGEYAETITAITPSG